MDRFGFAAVLVVVLFGTGCVGAQDSALEPVPLSVSGAMTGGESVSVTRNFTIDATTDVRIAARVEDGGVADACIVRQEDAEEWFRQRGTVEVGSYSSVEVFGCFYGQQVGGGEATLQPGDYSFALWFHDCPRADCGFKFGISGVNITRSSVGPGR